MFGLYQLTEILSQVFQGAVSIRITCPCNVYPLKPHFYIAKLGFVGVYLFFLFFIQNIDCGYSLEPPRRGGSNVDCGYSLEPPRCGGSNEFTQSMF